MIKAISHTLLLLIKENKGIKERLEERNRNEGISCM